MAKQQRRKTKYPGVYYVSAAGAKGFFDRIYYICYWNDGKLIEELAGNQSQDSMTAEAAAHLRMMRLKTTPSTNQQQDRGHLRQTQEVWTFDRLWETYKAHRPRLKGLVVDENRYKNHLKLPFGEREPRSLTPLEVDRLRLELLDTRRPGTVSNVLELLRRLVNFAAKKRLCETPDFTIEMPKVNNVKTEDLTAQELARLLKVLDEAPNLQVAHLMKMALYTGMRRGELFRLKWADIDFERGFIHIRDPKGGQDQKIPLNGKARELLQSHPRTDSPYVFPGRGGEKRVDVNQQVKQIKQVAGLPRDFRALHGLRHVFALILASSGQVDLYTLQKLLTHKSPTMTQRYAHLRDQALRQASDLAGNLIGQLSSGSADPGIQG
jgi:integrase